jgi:hypothetical protein
MSDEEPLMTLATFDSLMAAEVARSFLDAEGIRSFVADGEVVYAFSILSGAVGGVKLKVAKSDFLAAERLLNNQRGKYGPQDRDDYGLPLPSDAVTRDLPRKPLQRDAITKDPAYSQAPPETDDADEEDGDRRASTVDNLLSKAMLVGVLGIFICPVVAQAYSLQLLSQAQENSVFFTSRQTLLLRGLQVFNGLVLAAAIFLTVMLWATR